MDRILLDVHCHLVPLTQEQTLGLDGIGWDEQTGSLTIDGYTLTSAPVYQVEALLEWMDSNNVEKAWISIPPPLYRLGLDGPSAEEWATRVNEALVAVADQHPDRLGSMFYLPVQHPHLAASIVRDLATNHAPIFSMSAGSADGKVVISGGAYEALWQELDGAEAFLFLHPSKGCDPRYEHFYLHNLLGSPVETALAAAHLTLSGVLDRYRAMKLCLAHGGGAAAAVAGRLERGQVTGRPGANTGARRPREVLRNVGIDCICHDPAALEFAASRHGRDNVYFGSDWPFSMGLPEPHSQLEEVDQGLKRSLFQDNPERLIERFWRRGPRSSMAS